MEPCFDVLSRLRQNPVKPVPEADLKDAVAGVMQMLQLCIQDGDYGTLRQLAIDSVSTATHLGAPAPEQHDGAQQLACLSLLGRLTLRIVDNLAPRWEAERLLGRSLLARRVLREVAQRDYIQAATLRRLLNSDKSSELTQSNLARSIKRLTEARLVSADRAEDGAPWYGITLQGRRLAEKLFPELVTRRRKPDPNEPTSSQQRFSAVARMVPRTGRQTTIFAMCDLRQKR